MYFYLLLPISIPGVRMPYPLCLLSNVFKYKYLGLRRRRNLAPETWIAIAIARFFFFSESGKKSRVHVIEESMYLILLIDLIDIFLSRVLIDFFGVGF